jgi:cell division protein YceG involved in septum cleavage
MNFKKIYPFIILLIVFLFIGGNFIYNILSYNYNVPLNFKIKKGASVDEITKELEKENIISSSFSFKLYLILTGKHKNIKAGNYKIERQFNMIELSNILIKGGEGVKIKIIPGMTLKDIELLFKENGLNVNFQKYKLSHFSDLNLYNILKIKS